MSASIKEIIFKYVFVFLVLLIIGHLVKWLQLNISMILGIATGMALLDLAIYMFKKYKKGKKVEE